MNRSRFTCTVTTSSERSSREIEPRETTTLSFEADLTGRFEIEDHESEEVLGVLLVQPR